MTKTQIANYCRERIEGLHHQFRASEDVGERIECAAKQTAYKDIWEKCMGKPFTTKGPL